MVSRRRAHERPTVPSQVTAAAVYLRISDDREGKALGVERQRSDCETYCEMQGWQIAEVYSDNDTSAFTGERRYAYERMLRDVEAGYRDAVVAWDNYRLLRDDENDLHPFIRLAKSTGIRVATVKGGPVDQYSPNALLLFKILGALSHHESEVKRYRIAGKHLQLAQSGKVSGGGDRPFGYEDDRRTVKESEAIVVREMARRLLAGEACYSIAKDLNARGVLTPSAGIEKRGRKNEKGERGPSTIASGLWRPSTVRQFMMSARISGRREHHGEIVAPAEWSGIITEKESDAIRSLLKDPTRRSTPGNARSHLLSGFLRCGRCRQGLIAKGGRYRCVSRGANPRACGGVTISGAPLEAQIVAAVTEILESDNLKRVRASISSHVDDDEAYLRQVITEGERDLAELAAEHEAEPISPKMFMAAVRPIEDRIENARRRLAERNGPLTAWIGKGAELRDQWDDLLLFEQRQIINALIDHIDVMPTSRRGRVYDSDRVDPVWRT